MRVFQVKGFSGFMMLLLAVLGAFIAFILFPSAFVMASWNALIFEGLNGPEIALSQAFILWAALMIVIKLVMKPQISFQFRRMGNPDASKKKGLDSKKSERQAED